MGSALSGSPSVATYQSITAATRSSRVESTLCSPESPGAQARSEREKVYGISLGSDGRFYLTDTTTGDLGGPNAGPGDNAGRGDVFIVRYDS